jgi:aspartyl-tRNA(Asn)/glutamyl-tRNA(Gln) amidotransferase subunit C
MIPYRTYGYLLRPVFCRLLLDIYAMSLSSHDVRRIANLSRLAQSDGETQRLCEEINAILRFVAQLDAVDTTAIEPMSHAVELSQRLRPDTVTECNCRDELQAIAPQTQDGLYLVPKVIE